MASYDQLLIPESYNNRAIINENRALSAAAKKSAAEAKESEENAKASEDAAKESEDNAATSEANAGESADSARNSEASAKESAGNAAKSERSAVESEANAKESADSAAGSEEAAARSEERAREYALKSEGYATGEQNGEAGGEPYFENNAKFHAERAAEQARSAAESEANAKASEEGAAQSEESARSSADSAAESEENARASAEAAAESAREAAKSEANSSVPLLSERLATVESKIPDEASEENRLADRNYVARKIAEIIAEAPDSFDTLKEIADWISSHKDDASSMNSAITALENSQPTSANPLPLSKGGTGKTTANTAIDALMQGTSEMDNPNDNEMLLAQRQNNGTCSKYTLAKIWGWIKSKIESVACAPKITKLVGVTATWTGDILTVLNGNKDGSGLMIESGGVVIIGAGESGTATSAKVTSKDTEQLYLCADGNIYLKSNMQNGYDSAKTVTIDTAGTVTATKFSGPLTGTVTGNCTGNAATATTAITAEKIRTSTPSAPVNGDIWIA